MYIMLLVVFKTIGLIETFSSNYLINYIGLNTQNSLTTVRLSLYPIKDVSSEKMCYLLKNGKSVFSS